MPSTSFDEEKLQAITEDEFSDDHGSVSSTSSADGLSDEFGALEDLSTSRTSMMSTSHKSGIMDRADSRYVCCTKVMVLAVIAIAAAVCGTATYLITANDEEEAFREELETFAKEIVDISRLNAQATVSTIRGMSATVTSFSLHSEEKSEWPFVTVPDFQRRSEPVLELSKAKMVVLAPFVTSFNEEEYFKNTHSPEYLAWLEAESDLLSDHARGHDGHDRIRSRQLSNGEDIWEHFQSDDLMMPVAQASPLSNETLGLLHEDLFELPGNVGYHIHEATGWMLQVSGSTIADIQIYENTNLEDESTWPVGFFLEPVFQSFSADDHTVATLVAEVPWHEFLRNLMPEGTKPITVVLSSVLKGEAAFDDSVGGGHTCDHTITYEVEGHNVKFVGVGDIHDESYSEHVVVASMDLLEEIPEGSCEFVLEIYSTQAFADTYITQKPLHYMLVILGVFGATCLVFAIYDSMVKRRQRTLMAKAVRSNAILTSLFPAEVKERLLQEQAEKEKLAKNSGEKQATKVSPTEAVQAMANTSGDTQVTGKPIADLFPSATVMFADIAGFTAWSSTRDPAQVFTLLETIYSSFDAIAKKRKVFKVETIGDCYVACCGLPEPREDHAEVMAYFAQDCRAKMNSVVRKLEVTLGPDTSDLAMRIGLHSGAVTAGVLRGEKSRFQLFGDTVNTAARIESTGESDRIHVSQTTADLLMAAGKEQLLVRRENTVEAKGKGVLQTYWLRFGKDRRSRYSSVAGSGGSISGELSTSDSSADVKSTRLIKWNVEVLAAQLKRILAMREENAEKQVRRNISLRLDPSAHVLDEVKEVIPLRNEAKAYRVDPETIVLPEKVMEQLYDYVSSIAELYHDENPFHCFEHASHVAQSATKLLSRVVQAEKIDYSALTHKELCEVELHDNTFGITSDPIIQFALSYSALIHDVDHTGVPNATLVAEETELAKHYNNKSVAEQNSVDLAWDLLQEPTYKDLRACIYETKEELERFRQLVVNAVMATDICDKELGALRKERWNKAFSGTATIGDSQSTIVNRKATIVIEHLIQASDVAHTMQHWHVYLKWNEKLFDELMKAYLEGRSETNPVEGWYKGEIGFFDFYIIPLAKKLKDCGVFGVSSDEYLEYAMANRKEWEAKGEAVVAQYMEKYKSSRKASMR